MSKAIYDAFYKQAAVQEQVLTRELAIRERDNKETQS